MAGQRYPQTALVDDTSNLVSIQQYINYYKGKDLTYYKGYLNTDYSFHVMDLWDNFFNEDVTDNIDTLVLTTYEIADYQYNPKGLSQALYGTPDMWAFILRTNNLDSPGDMDFADGTIKVPNARALSEFLSTTYSNMRAYFAERGFKW